MSVLGVANVLS